MSLILYSFVNSSGFSISNLDVNFAKIHKPATDTATKIKPKITPPPPYLKPEPIIIGENNNEITQHIIIARTVMLCSQRVALQFAQIIGLALVHVSFSPKEIDFVLQFGQVNMFCCPYI